MNPHTNKFEALGVGPDGQEQMKALNKALEEQLIGVREVLVRPDGSPVPSHWTVLHVGELLVIKGYTFKVAYVNESTLLLEPVRPDAPLGVEPGG